MLLGKYRIIYSLQLLLGVCEKELERLDMTINVKKTSSVRIGPSMLIVVVLLFAMAEKYYGEIR